jgi:hypothetical protein
VKQVIVYGFPTREDRDLHETSRAIVFAEVSTCRDLKRQMHLNRQDTGHSWKAYYDKETGMPLADYQAAIIFLGGSIKNFHECDEKGDRM